MPSWEAQPKLAAASASSSGHSGGDGASVGSEGWLVIRIRQPSPSGSGARVDASRPTAPGKTPGDPDTPPAGSLPFGDRYEKQRDESPLRTVPAALERRVGLDAVSVRARALLQKELTLSCSPQALRLKQDERGYRLLCEQPDGRVSRPRAVLWLVAEQTAGAAMAPIPIRLDDEGRLPPDARVDVPPGTRLWFCSNDRRAENDTPFVVAPPAGGPHFDERLESVDAPRLAAFLRDAEAKRLPVTFGSKARSPLVDDGRLQSTHAYAFMGLRTDGDTTWVRLLDPQRPHSSTGEHGILELRREHLLAGFGDLMVGGVAGVAAPEL